MNSHNSNLACVILALTVSVVSAATELHVPQVRLPLMSTAPVIDGEVKEDEWAGAARMERFGWAGRLSPQEASFWVGCDGKELLIAVVSETPPGGKILSRAPPAPEDGDARTFDDDSVEMVIDPLRADTTSRRRLYHANLNARGAVNDTAYQPNGVGEAWRGHWRLANKIIGNRWHFEIALPLADMGVTADDLKNPFGIRICRNWQQQNIGPLQTEWGAMAGAYLNPATLPGVTWDARAPVVQILQLHDADKHPFHPRVAIRNPYGEPMEVKATIQCVPKSSAPSKLERTVTLTAPNSIETVELAGNGMPGEEIFGSIQVTSADGQTVYYLRDFNCKLGRPDPMWATNQDAAKKVEVNFAYFPYHNTIKAIVNVNGLAERDQVAGVKLSVRAKDNPKPLATTPMPALKKFASEMEWPIPPLKEGNYQLVVEVDGVKVEPMVTDFVRHVMPWEHNRLGKSDAVIEPFEPIQVRDTKVSTVLRTHTLNRLGLFEQVESLGQPLLKGPMRLEVKTGDPSTTLRASPSTTLRASGKLKFAQKKPMRAVTESKWKAGAVTGTARGEWDYDGLMKWTLEIQPAKEPIEAVTLVIPLDNKRMPLFHACTDGIRFNYAGATPAGQGRVWDGGKAARNSIIGSYVPYIWVGAEERGLAVFGENDRGWVRDPKVPCQELVRNGDTLELRLNLIAAPTKIEEPRRITIGFQATPTKPMPEGWRAWTVACGKAKGVQLDFGFLGSCWYWGSLGPCADVYPRNEDFSLYEKFAETRRTGQIDKDFIAKWLAGYPKMDEATMQAYPPHINCGFNVMSSRPERVLVYTNARGVRFDTREGQTFLDEWHRDAFPTRKWGLGGAVAYDLDPVESFRDYAMWYYQKMFDTFVEDIYWDDIFMQSNFDTVGTEAYALPDGTIQPSSGLFNMRELVRRTAVFQHERKKRGYNMAHMTNTAIAPILAFAGTLYTWEDRTGDTDFQDRWSRDYLRAESIGRQHGCVPYSLTLINGAHNDPKNAWVLRTAAAVALTHEIKPSSGYIYPAYWSNYVRLLEFGYGQPEVRVWNYWDADYPVHIEGSETSSLVASKPGSAIIVVCDYGKGGELKLRLDAALKLGNPFTAKDPETGQPVTVGADGSITFPLQKHDFKLVLVESAAVAPPKP